jgi:hypothetical protein
MTLRRIALGPWMPDAPPLEAPGPLVASGCVPFPGGKAPYPGLVSLSEYGALDAYARGFLGTSDRDGSPENFAGNATKLYRMVANVLTNISRGGGYGATRRWEFAVFASEVTGLKPLVIATDYDDPVQGFEIGTDAIFSNLTTNVAQPGLGDPGGIGAPRARHVGIVGNFVMLGDVFDLTNGHVQNGIWWCAIGNGRSWPVPGSAPAISAQADRDTLPGQGGGVTRIISGQDSGVIFRERSIWRADYIGGDAIFNLREAEPELGALYHHLAIAFGGRALFWSEQGWRVFDGTTSEPVGRGIVDDFFRSDLQIDFIDRISWIIDPSGPRVLIGYVGQGNTGGTPNRVLVFDQQLAEWGVFELQHECLIRLRNPGPNLSMDRLPSPIPDSLSGGWDDVALGAAIGGAFDTSHQVGTFTGTSMVATIETGDLELVPGRRAQVQGARPIVVSGEPTIALARRRNYDDPVAYGADLARRESGVVKLRGDGRYHRVRLTLPSGWGVKASCVDLEYRETGGR